MPSRGWRAPEPPVDGGTNNSYQPHGCRLPGTAHLGTKHFEEVLHHDEMIGPAGFGGPDHYEALAVGRDRVLRMVIVGDESDQGKKRPQIGRASCRERGRTAVRS